MEEITETVLYEEDDSESTEALLESYEERRKCRLDDVIAMQAAVCIIAVVGMFVLNLFYPETAEGLLSKLKKCMENTDFVIKNPIDYVVSHIQKA